MHLRRRQALLLQQLFDGGGMLQRQFALDRIDLGISGFAAEDLPKALAKPLIVGLASESAGGRNGLAVGLDQRRVDPVERGAAHQPEGKHRPARRWSRLACHCSRNPIVLKGPSHCKSGAKCP
jgi:hypothetical protein